MWLHCVAERQDALRISHVARRAARRRLVDRNNEACAMKLTVNGQRRVLQEVDPTMPLLWAVRDLLGLKGTKFGCGQALCGACTVHLDGQPIRSCQTSLADVGDGKVTTIEAIAGRVAEAVKSAWIKNNVPQCGYCQSGQIMSAVALLESNPKPSRDDINSAMSGNLCRCGTYPRIRAAIADASNVLEHQ
jgi:isoquinoline 1-oxidoreductase subunit alpha